MLGWALVFFLEVVSRPHREEKRLLRLLVERDAAWARLRTPHSLRAATWGGGEETAQSIWQTLLKWAFFLRNCNTQR